ncbi:UDP-2,3-diacylglucosamine diphosphatase [Marinomonas sp. THO17]|uniref:UDP-2,3-diacylglucosamine diphosphatase n=1 Tax=Marinomonas sp. THO17 TaxID=3149048 RepID=UPI00336BD361
MKRFFISDLHLSDKRPDLIRAFVQMLSELKTQFSPAELYLLGDFYEAWIGDDYQPDWNQSIEQALTALSKADWQIYFLHGNRDFLIGDTWLKRVGATLLDEQTRLQLNEGNLLLSHGDEYCLADTQYQAFRRTVRSSAWQQEILSLPIEQRIALASQLRNDSKSMSTEKSMSIMDVTDDAIKSALTQHQCKAMIHGHTHRPAIHQDGQYVRCVLGDWDEFVWFASLEQGQFVQSKAKVDNFLAKGLKSLKTEHQLNLFPFLSI